MKNTKKVFALIIVFIMCLGICTPAFAQDKVDISSAIINVLDANNIEYTSAEIKPNVEVKLNDTLLVKNTDYSVSYENNIDAGVATVVVTGVNNYTGIAKKDFKIKQLSLYQLVNNGTIKINKEKLLVGKNVKLSVTSKKFGELVNNKDYTIELTKNDKVGKNSAKLKISGIGNFKGYVVYSLNVYPKKVTGIKVTSKNSNGVNISWDSQKNLGVTGYKVYTCDSKGNIDKCVAVTKETKAFIKRNDSSIFNYTVKAYYQKDSKSGSVYSQEYTVKSNCAKPSKVIMNSCANSGKKTVVVKWAREKGSGYELQYSTNSDFKGAKTILIDDSRIVEQKISVSDNTKKYYVKVRAFRNYNGKAVYGSWSSSVNNKYSVLYKSYFSYYVNNKNRTANLRLASKAINGTILAPGETFSFNEVVGKRTAEKGYKAAHVFTGPNSMTEGIGGGVCQVASTMFNAVLLSNLTVVERHQHSQRVSYVPLGRDAAIYWGSEDFKFKNTTDSSIMIKMSVENGKITCSLYVCEDVKPKKVNLKVSRSGNNFTLKRYVDGKCNYTTKSHY